MARIPIPNEGGPFGGLGRAPGGANPGDSGRTNPAIDPYSIQPGSSTTPSDISAAGVAGTLDNFPNPQQDFNALLARMMAGANAGPRANPYNPAMADRTRGAQQALYAQMLGQAQGGPSVTGAQMNIAQGQSAAAQAAAMAGGRGPLAGANALMQGANVNAGLAGQAGQNRAMESAQLAGQSMAGTGGMRGRDIQSAVAQSNAGLQQRALDDAATRFYVSQGMDLASAQRQSALEAYKFHRRLTNQIKAKQDQTASDIMGVVGGIMSLGMGGGPGGLMNAAQGATTSGDKLNGG